MQNGEMVLTGADRTADGKDRLVRGVWKREAEGVRETAARSTDGGKTWNPWFDLMFRPAAKAASNDPARDHTPDDKTLLAALDTEFQAAVKVNDVSAIDRLLAANFTLVVGSGKTFTKADLLEEARSGQYQYDHQEDTEQTVRVFGDSAVVTAKLWAAGTHNGKPFDSTLWFTDTYLRTPTGWRYVFGQASLPLPKPSQ
jgi:ketosteroid isomerase-like protein